MTQASTLVALHSSRLIRLLTELAVTEVEPSTRRFGDRFGQLFALSDSISLSNMHSQLAGTEFEPRDAASDELTQATLDMQRQLVLSISERFKPPLQEGPARNRFPALRPGANAEQLSTYNSYQAFYINLQREMDREIQHLLSILRDAASGLSAELAKLVVIDSELSDTLGNHARKLFAQVPRLLERRFQHLRQSQHPSLFDAEQDDHQQWLQSGGWLYNFRLDMHQTALAELELRLQPALGLLEAIQAHCPNGDDNTADSPADDHVTNQQHIQQEPA